MLSLFFGALAGCGIGGGGLIVIYLTFVKDLNQVNAQGINLLFFVFSAAASLTVHLRKRKINFPLVAVLSSSGVVGSFLGSHTASVLPPFALRKMFGVMLIISGTITVIRIIKDKRKSKAY